ncbi:MAG: zinc ribbon domain-containing protein [Anaerolineae bacterium]|nr:zinc ribbon domain-containing protein [Anaerolineae bacterium]
MSIGALLIGLAALILVVAYIVSPFQRKAEAVDLDAQIEAWVTAARRAEEPKVTVGGGAPAMAETQRGVSHEKVAHYCHHCGEPVRPDHRFCPNCGTRLVDD